MYIYVYKNDEKDLVPLIDEEERKLIVSSDLIKFQRDIEKSKVSQFKGFYVPVYEIDVEYINKNLTRGNEIIFDENGVAQVRKKSEKAEKRIKMSEEELSGMIRMVSILSEWYKKEVSGLYALLEDVFVEDVSADWVLSELLSSDDSIEFKDILGFVEELKKNGYSFEENRKTEKERM